MKPNPSQAPYPTTGVEPSLDELFAEPIVQKLMERDRERKEDLTELLGLIRKHLIAARWRRTP